MSEISNLIFHNAKHKLSSPFGERAVIETSRGETSPFHNGVDYSTYGKKLPQYAVDKGVVISCGTDYAYGAAKYVWVKYSSLGVKMLHYHLDKIKVKTGQSVDENTVLGYTGKTGMATGIHLHLGLKRLSGGGYIDPEKWSKEEFPNLKKSSNKEKFPVGNYIVTTALLNVRSGPGKSCSKRSFSRLTPDAQKKILKLSGKKCDGYVKGLCFTVLEVCGSWGRTPSGWVCLDYCEVIS
ncbi:MAG: M23 family metallopeptidase [Clostridia bacterium]|nr:M23 family metallopeptidase [Clostridia bacterium]